MDSRKRNHRHHMVLLERKFLAPDYPPMRKRYLGLLVPKLTVLTQLIIAKQLPIDLSGCSIGKPMASSCTIVSCYLGSNHFHCALLPHSFCAFSSPGC